MERFIRAPDCRARRGSTVGPPTSASWTRMQSAVPWTASHYINQPRQSEHSRLNDRRETAPLIESQSSNDAGNSPIHTANGSPSIPSFWPSSPKWNAGSSSRHPHHLTSDSSSLRYAGSSSRQPQYDLTYGHADISSLRDAGSASQHRQSDPAPISANVSIPRAHKKRSRNRSKKNKTEDEFDTEKLWTLPVDPKSDKRERKLFTLSRDRKCWSGKKFVASSEEKKAVNKERLKWLNAHDD